MTGEDGGERADLHGADLQRAGLQQKDLRLADLHGADLHGSELENADLQHAVLQRADLRCTDLLGAKLYHADMRDANIDYASWPLWCGSLKAYVDDRIAIQLLYHTLSVVQYSPYVSEDVKRTLLTQDVVDVANRFHRVDECGKLKTWEEIKGEE